MTIAEYKIMMEAYKLKAVDDSMKMHMQAYLNYSVQAEKQVGKNKTKPVYDRFEKFFDYEKELAKVQKKPKKHRAGRFDGIGGLLKKGGA